MLFAPSSSGESIRLSLPERDKRVDGRRAPRRPPAGDQRHPEHYERHRSDREQFAPGCDRGGSLQPPYEHHSAQPANEQRPPEQAQALLGDAAWSWLHPDRPEPRDRWAPGPALAELTAVVDALEKI